MLSFLYVYSDHSILECYNLFSGVELSMRSFFVISNVTSNVSMNLNPFMVFKRSSRCDSVCGLVFVKWFNGFKLS